MQLGCARVQVLSVGETQGTLSDTEANSASHPPYELHNLLTSRRHSWAAQAHSFLRDTLLGLAGEAGLD
jgi:hypothetical protein